MASGSNAPFSGEFVDLENVPKLPKGISAEQIFEQNADAIRQAAESRHAAGLSQVNADGGFFDAFVNNSKISNLNNSVLGSRTLRLAKAETTLDDFEDGVDSNWSGDTGSLSAITTVVLEGSQSGRLSTNSFTAKVNYSESNLLDSVGEELIFLVQIDSKGSTSADSVRFDFKNNGSTVDRIRFLDNGTLDTSNSSSSWFTDKTYKVSYKIVSSSETAITIKNITDGVTEIDETIPTGSNIDNFVFQNSTNNNGFARSAYFDGFVRKSGRVTSGTATEQQFTFTDTQGNSFSPSKVGIFPDQTLNGQSISYDLKDSTGTVVKTFNQSDLNQLISVSTTDDTFQVEANLSGDGTQTPELEFLDVRGV